MHISYEDIANLPLRLEQHFRHENRDIIPSELIRLLVTLIGAQIESTEISCSILLPPPGSILHTSQLGVSIRPPDRFPDSFILPRQPGSRLHFASHIRLLRDSLGRVGDAAELVAVLNNSGAIDQLLLLRHTTSMCELSKIGDVVHIRPPQAMSIFKNGREVCHVLRLRDGTGWVIRDTTEERQKFRHHFGGAIQNTDYIDIILNSLWSASQQARGMALVILNGTQEDYYVARSRRDRDMTVTTSFGLHSPVKISSAPELCRLAMLDGATIISRSCEVVDAGVYFNAPGGRHQSSVHVSNSYSWVAGVLAVSEDGPISWFKKHSSTSIAGDLVRYL